MIAGATHKRSDLGSDWMPEYIQVVGDIAHTYTKLHGWSEDAWVDKLAYCEIDSPYDVGAHVSDASKPVYTKEMHEADEPLSAGLTVGSAVTVIRGGNIIIASEHTKFIGTKSTLRALFENESGTRMCVIEHRLYGCLVIPYDAVALAKTEREIAIDAANEMTLHDLATAVIRGNSIPGIHDAVLLERLAKIDKADKL